MFIATANFSSWQSIPFGFHAILAPGAYNGDLTFSPAILSLQA